MIRHGQITVELLFIAYLEVDMPSGISDKPFWKRALIPYFRNPSGWNADSLITWVGILVWAIVALGASFDIAVMPPSVGQVGSMIFGYGIRGAKEAGNA
jgi:hypothetical protein